MAEAWGSLRPFLAFLESRGELHRVEAEVDPHLEIAAVTDRVSKGAGGGRALLFEKVRGERFPVLTNLFGSLRRSSWALGGEELETVAGRLARELSHASGDAAERLRTVLERPEFAPRPGAEESCLEIVEKTPDLRILPALKAWPLDGGPFLTLPHVFTRDPQTGDFNCGIYRMQIFDGLAAGMHWRPDSDAGRHHAAWSVRRKRMPVAVALGGDPAMTFSAASALPSGIDEAAYAGFLRGSPVEMMSCPESDLQVPAGAEILLEGYVEPGEKRKEGPFGNHTGCYAPPAPCPVFHLTAMSRRNRPIYSCTVVGPPPTENCWMAKTAERLLLPMLRIDFPEVIDVNFPLQTVFHGCALLSVRVPAGGGRELIRSLWGSRYFRSSRLLLLLPEGEDVHDPTQAYWRAVNGAVPEKDVIVDEGRIGIDATGISQCRRVAADAGTERLIRRRWREYGLA